MWVKGKWMTETELLVYVEELEKRIKELENPPKVNPVTNLDKIRSYSVKELAEFLDRVTISCSTDGGACDNCPLKGCEICCGRGLEEWLRSEVQNDN